MLSVVNLILKLFGYKFHDEVFNFFGQAGENNFEDIIHQTYHMTEEGHGRSEKRSFYVTEDIDWLPQRNEWAGLKSIILLVSECTVNGEMSTEHRAYFSSRDADARKIAHAIRSHWGVESCHWILDVAFDEEVLGRACDFVITIWSPVFIQRQRALRRDGMTPEKLHAIVQAQYPQPDKKQMSDLALPSSLGRAETNRRLRKWLKSAKLL